MVIFILIYFVTGCYMAANLCLTMEEPFFPLDDAKETFDRIIAFIIAVVAWPIVLLLPYLKGMYLGYKESYKNELKKRTGCESFKELLDKETNEEADQ